LGDSGEGKIGRQRTKDKENREQKTVESANKAEQLKGIDRNLGRIKKTQATSQSVEAHSKTSMWTEMVEVVMPDSLEEKQL